MSAHAGALLVEDNPALGLADDGPGSNAAAKCPFIPFAAMAASVLPWRSSRGAESNSCDGQCQSSFPGLQLVQWPRLRRVPCLLWCLLQPS